MQLDFLKGIRGNGALTYAGPERLVRLSRFSASEAEAFHRAVRELADGVKAQLWLEDLPFVEANGYSLVLEAAAEDNGLDTRDERLFCLKLSTGSLGRVLRAVEPFCEDGAHGHVWLLDEPGGIGLLLSTGGSW